MNKLILNLVDPYIIAIDSTLLRAKGHLWHKSYIIKGAVPRSGIDTDARWGFSHTKSSTGSLIIPLSADFTQADVHDNQRYPAVTSSLPNKERYATGDLGYDDHKLYKFSTDKGLN